jgi:putative ABC transport system permease protein
LDERLISELDAIPGVGGVTAERVVQWQYEGGPITIEAFDPSYFTSERFGRWALLGRHAPNAWEAVGEGRGTVVSSNFVSNLGVAVGDEVELKGPGGRHTVHVVGVTLDFASPRGTIKISRDLYRQLWGDNHITLAFVDADDGVDVAALRRRISGTLARKYDLSVISSRELVSHYADQVRQAFGGVDVLGGLILVVIVVGLGDTLIAAVLERRRYFAAVRAVGVSGRQLGSLIVSEGVLIAVAGFGLALCGGLALGVLWTKATFPSLLGWALELHIPYGRIAIGACMVFAVALLASLIPANRAARVDPSVALRYD